MFGIRRYRLFLLIAALTIGTIYYLSSSRWQSENGYDNLKSNPINDFNVNPAAKEPEQPPVVPPAPPKANETPEPPDELKATTSAQSPEAALPTLDKPSKPSTSISSSTSAWEEEPTISGEELLKKPPTLQNDLGQEGKSRQENDLTVQDPRRAHWSKTKSQFPLKAADVIPLPSGKEKLLPKIQGKFRSESPAQKKDRLSKLATIRESFKHAWNGYKTYGLPHDEIRPISKGFADPFMGWGATLVDSLDSLWIMGLKDDFAEAVEEVAKIDFTTSLRKDIPLFETVIRYLGGLIAAWDLSGNKYPVLLNQAEVLAEILIGAFDTPNRMPIPFYHWAPSYTSQAHRASAHIVMAELGSLSMEFTRLAQITKKDIYYDAIARVTDELEKWQMQTSMPGLWPLKLDASGCKKPKLGALHDWKYDSQPTLIDDEESLDSNLLNGEEPAVYPSEPKDDDPASNKRRKRASDDNELPSYKQIDQQLLQVDCEPQGLSTEPHTVSENFGIGGQADSTYEYFPKMYALLGGQIQQYRTMYIESLRAIRKQLLFRPMIKDESRKILFSSKWEVFHKQSNGLKKKPKIKYEVTHLSCFAGGMFALGSKIFDREDDMQFAKQLTDGCVWAYESMPNGVMAEDATVVPCDSLEPCAWNETKWHEFLDPLQKERFAAVDTWNKNQKQILEQVHKQTLKEVREEDTSLPEQTAVPEPGKNSAKEKRQEDLSDDELPSRTTSTLKTEDDESDASSESMSFVPKVALSHERFVKARIQEERLPSSYTGIIDRHYGLRPEAIESVFYMYRITGDEEWRNKGWQMFEAVQRATQTSVANAAMRDVTSDLSLLDDKMESFWLAETLKYFYLLFSDPSLVSLDDYVLNTEAHPFKLPK